ncbi:hypothetical protein ACTFIZ_012397 [Dictyostelium cf. discoideum]
MNNSENQNSKTSCPTVRISSPLSNEDWDHMISEKILYKQMIWIYNDATTPLLGKENPQSLQSIFNTLSIYRICHPKVETFFSGSTQDAYLLITYINRFKIIHHLYTKPSNILF